MKTFTLILLSLMEMIFLTQCKPKYQEVNVSFPVIDGIVEGTPVVWNGAHIGRVSYVTASEKGALVTLNINPEYSKIIVSAAAFLVNKEGNESVLEYHIFDINSPPLKNGESLQGAMSRAGLLLLKAKYFASEGLGELHDYLKHIEKDLDKFKESKEFENIMKSIDKNIEEAVKLGKKGNEIFIKEIVPTLQKKMDELQQKIEKVIE